MKLYQLKEILMEDLEETPKVIVDRLFNSLRHEWKFKPEGKYVITVDGKMYVIEKEK